MHHVFLVTVLSLHVGYSLTSSDSSQKYGSHNLLKLEQSNSSVQRSVRCTPCEDSKYKKPVSNHLDRDYRGNGADNLGYDWSSMAWGGLAFPRRSKFYGMAGRGGRMMPTDWRSNEGNVRIVCDTCRTYWDGNVGGGRNVGRDGRQFDGRGGGDFYGGQPGYWQRDKMPDEYETRVMSPTVGVLVKPGSRIAYIPSRSGEMYWDGISGGGTRWDGFSNGISWVSAPNAPEWDRSDSGVRDDKPGQGTGSLRPGGDYPYSSSGFGPWDGMKRPLNWDDGRGKGYYFTNGVANDIDPQWRGRGYASNWHYGSTNQNGWNGNNMKWNYGGKQWADNDRAANRFYFNTPQNRNYGPTDGRQQYGSQYPNYQPGGGYPSSFRPQPSWPPSGGYRPNDRFPGNFPQESLAGGDKDKPWDYTLRDPPGHRRPGPRPEWIRPGPSYPPPGNFDANSGRFPGNYGGYDKYSPSDRNDFEKPWSRPSGYGPSKPSPSGTFPYGGNRFPEDGGGRPGFSFGSGNLFIPNGDNRQPSYPNMESGGGRPMYPTRKPGEYQANQVGTYPGDGGRPSVVYTGGRPLGGEGSSGSYPDGGSGYGFPSTESSVGGSGTYPGGSRPGSGYPSSSGGYPGGESPYPSGISRPGGYPTGGGYPEGGRPGGFVGVGGRPDKYGSGGSSGGYPGGDGSSFARPGTYPSAGGAGYPGGNRPGLYPDEGYPQPAYFGGTRPTGYPTGTRPTGYPTGSRPTGYPTGSQPTGYPTGSRPTGYPTGTRPSGYPGESNRPDEYPSGGRPGYPSTGSSLYPGSGSGGSGEGYPQGSKNPMKGYYTGFITELAPDDGQSQYGGRYPNQFGGSYPGKDRNKYFYGGSYPNRPASGDRGTYPAYSEDRYSGGGGGGYPGGGDRGTGYDGGSDKFYYGQSGGGKGKYPEGYPSNHRHPGGGNGGDFDRNQGSGDDKNAWNYGQNEHKDGIYRRSGGSYPPYRGGQYYTSSYLASMPTTSGSTQAGTEPKTQTVTKADEVTQSTLDSS